MPASAPVQIRLAATDLTGSYVVGDGSTTTTQFEISGMYYHTLLLFYDPDATSSTIKLNVKIDLSWDPMTTAAASSTWVSYRTFDASSTAIDPLSPVIRLDSDDSVSTTGTIDFRAHARKIRVSFQEAGTPGNFGNCATWLFSSAA